MIYNVMNSDVILWLDVVLFNFEDTQLTLHKTIIRGPATLTVTQYTEVSQILNTVVHGYKFHKHLTQLYSDSTYTGVTNTRFSRLH